LHYPSLYSASFVERNSKVLAQQYVPTIKYRNLVIDLGNGVKTNAQLTYPAIGKGPFPGVLLIHGSGADDKHLIASESNKTINISHHRIG
jgi:uncharacterized protein